MPGVLHVKRNDVEITVRIFLGEVQKWGSLGHWFVLIVQHGEDFQRATQKCCGNVLGFFLYLQWVSRALRVLLQLVVIIQCNRELRMEDAKIEAICFPDKHFQILPPLQNVMHFPEGLQEPLELAVLRCLLQSCRSTNEAQKLFFSIWLHVFNDFSFPSPKPGAVPHNSWERSGGESSNEKSSLAAPGSTPAAQKFGITAII